jgi:hypothetical protein
MACLTRSTRMGRSTTVTLRFGSITELRNHIEQSA